MADLEGRGIPTVGVATTEFIEGAAAGAKSLGIDPALVFIPHPVQDRTDDELKKLADDHLEPILALLVKGGGPVWPLVVRRTTAWQETKSERLQKSCHTGEGRCPCPP